MEIKITGEAKEIAALVLAVQERQAELFDKDKFFKALDAEFNRLKNEPIPIQKSM